MFQNLHLLRNAVMFNLDIFLIFRDEWQRNRVSSCYQDIWPCSCSLDEIKFTLICFYLNFLPVQLLKKIIYKILWCSSVVKLQLLFVGVYIPYKYIYDCTTCLTVSYLLQFISVVFITANFIALGVKYIVLNLQNH